MADDLGKQTSIQSNINDLFKERIKLLEEQEKILSRQAEIANKLREALGSGANLNSQIDSVQQLNGALDQNSKSLDKSQKVSESLWSSFTKKSKEVFKGLKEFFTLPNLFTNIGAAISNVVGSMINLATAILSIPFKMFDAFVDLANKFEFNPAIFLALQEIKEAFGALSTGPAKAVADNLRTIRREIHDLANTGLSVYRVFGYGPEGIAEALKAVNDLATNLGAAFYNLQDVIRRNGIQMVMMAKGLGLSNEQMAAQMRFAQAMGKDPVKAQFEFANAALQTGKAFGMSSKIIARGMNDLIQTFPQLGKQGPKALAPIVAYAQKLGLEIKDLNGVFEKFSSFESAADSASQLSQAFGVNIDAMRIMSEENPAKKIEMLRLAFQSAGKDATHMGVAERKLAEQLTGVSGAAFDAAFGLGNKKAKMSEVEKQTQQAMKTQMSQIKIMKELGKAIKLIAPPPPKEFQGPLDALIQGFELGIRRAHDARKAMINFRLSMMTLYYLGRDLGIMFVKYFPGVKEVFQALAKFFQPGKFRAFSAEARTAFAAFFKDPVEGFNGFIDKMKQMIDKHFGSGAGGVLSLFTEGANKFTKVAGALLGKTIALVADLIVDGLRSLTEIIAGRKRAIIPGAKDAASFAENIFGPLKDALFKALPEIGSALGDVFSALWVKIKGWWKTDGKAKAQKIWDEYWPWFVGIALLQFGGPLMTLVGGISSMLGGAFSLLSKSPAVMSAMKNAAFSLSGSFAKFMDPLNSPILGKFFPDLTLKIMMGFSKIIPLLKAGLTKIPLIGTIIAGIIAIFDGWKVGEKDGLAAGIQEFGASFVSMLTFGLFSKENIKKAGEWVGDQLMNIFTFGASEFDTEKAASIEKEAIAQATKAIEAEQKKMKSATAISADQYEEMLTSGKKEEALKHLASKRLAEMVASGEFVIDKENQQRAAIQMNDMLAKLRAEMLPQLEKDTKDALKKSVDKAEAEKIAKIEKAKILVEQIKDIGALQNDVDKGLKTLDSALKAGDFEKKLGDFSTKIASIYPKIEDAVEKISNARTRSLEITDEDNPVESLVKIFKSVTSLGKFINDASKALTDSNIALLKGAVEKLFGQEGTSDPNAIVNILAGYQDIELNASIFKSLEDAFEAIEKAVNSAFKAQKTIGNMNFFAVGNFIKTSIEFLSRKEIAKVEDLRGFIPLTSAMESIADAAKFASTAEKYLTERTADQITSFVIGVGSAASALGTADIFKMIAISNAIARVAEASITAGTTFKSAAQVVTAVNKFKGGEVKVSHTIPQVKMDVVINLDTKEFARKMIEVNVAKEGTKSKRIDFSTHSDKINYGD